MLIVGGGPAGVCAAIAAARNGAKVLVVEQSGMLGGMATQGLVGPFMTCYDKAGEKMIIRGLFEEIVERLVARGGALHPKGVFGNGPYSAWIPKGHDHVTPFDPEELKVLLDEMCAEAGVKVLLHTMFVEPIVRDGKACGARLFGKGGYRTVSAKIVVDATGDGDYAFRAGVPCILGDGKGRLMPATMFFRVCNVDSVKLIADVEANQVRAWMRKGDPNVYGKHGWHPGIAARCGRGNAEGGRRHERRRAGGQRAPCSEFGGCTRRQGQPDGVIVHDDQRELVRRLVSLPCREGRRESAARRTLPFRRACGGRGCARDAALHGDGPGGRDCGGALPEVGHDAARAGCGQACRHVKGAGRFLGIRGT